ncbi:hypothetical protein B0H16DRAFT_1885717 [Mycena metata]|uniref:Uncharacterized protein n=1 Tax=Mycena metata TaxID=1033252 RepID=A0AAD7J4J4_9AGAR|nr:hypothetical protein B0H16DRAFT_1885717 [Mycena metata]
MDAIPSPDRASPQYQLDLCLHALAALHGPKVRLEAISPHDIESRQTLKAFFLGDERATGKFIQVAQAIVTLATAGPKENNFSVMLGYSDTEVHLFYAQSGGNPNDQVERYLDGIWSSLRKIQRAAHGVLTPEMASAPHTSMDTALVRELLELAFHFVEQKAFHRAKKRAKIFTALKENQTRDTSDFDQDLVLYLDWIASSTHINQLLNRTAVFYDFTQSADYGVKSGDAIDRIQAQSMALPNAKNFDLRKVIRKLTKINAAVNTLHQLALSPRRGWMVATTTLPSWRSQGSSTQHQVKYGRY